LKRLVLSHNGAGFNRLCFEIRSWPHASVRVYPTPRILSRWDLVAAALLIPVRLQRIAYDG
jgi:hypothetical protein